MHNFTNDTLDVIGKTAQEVSQYGQNKQDRCTQCTCPVVFVGRLYQRLALNALHTDLECFAVDIEFFRMQISVHVSAF